MKVIGLTGGIGAGKSTASSILSENGCRVLDADAISREITSDGSPALTDIAEAFGQEYVSGQSLNRKALADLVFNDEDSLGRLREIITGRVVKKIVDETNEARGKDNGEVLVVDAPLLFECGLEKLTDENWLVTSDLETRLARVSARDGLSEDEIMARINNQMSEEEKICLSQRVLDNSGTVEGLRSQIIRELERIRDEDR